jgi:SH3-like domain-containing protein
MKKINTCYLFFIILLFLNLFLISKIAANEDNFFLSLKNQEVNLRQGPSFEYPIKFTYKKRYLPVIIIDRSETWREIKDFENNSGWIHISQLSKKKSAINTKNNSILYKKPTIYSKPIAKLETGRLVLIKRCKEKWCKITTGGFKGWIFENSLWGKIK